LAKKIPNIIKDFKSKTPTPVEGAKTFSYSQLTTYLNCPKQWQYKYLDKLGVQEPSIHLVFGTAFHETLQAWLDVVYNGSIKDANEMDVNSLLYNSMVKEYVKQKESSDKLFSSSEELQMFYLEGTYILDYIKRKRLTYFSSKQVHLAGIETLLYRELRPNVYYRGYIDLVFYNEATEKWLILDIKTSTTGWNKWQKADDTKIAQILLYKEYFAEQYGVSVDNVDVEYFIVKRHIPVEADFPAMQRRVQQFVPASGKIKRGKAISALNSFVKSVLEEGSEVIDKQHISTPSEKACRFCDFAKLGICKDAIIK